MNNTLYNKYSSWIRPGVMMWLTILFTYLILSNHTAKESYISLLETIMVVVYTSYFVGKSSEKIFKPNGESKYELNEGDEYDRDIDENIKQ